MCRADVARLFPLDYGNRGRTLLRRDRRAEQLYPMENADVETGWYWLALCDRNGACRGYSAEPDDGSTYLGLLFPAVQSTWANLSAVHCVMVLPCNGLYLCR